MNVRTERDNKFKNEYLDKLGFNYDIEYLERMDRYTIYNTNFGDLDFYPKANKLLIRKDNKWIKPGLNWIIKNLNLS